MNNYPAFNGASFKHDQQQPLTPISTLTQYHHDSPGHGHTLPPLNQSSAQQYRPAAPATPRLPHTPDTPNSADPHSGGMQHHPAMQQPHMPAAEPHTSYAPVPSAFSGAPSNSSYATHNGLGQGAPNGYASAHLPHLSSATLGGPMDYRSQPGNAQYPYPSQHHQMQQQQPPPPQSQPSQLPPQLPSLQAQDRRPMPVVGSQGRRGILPTTGGKAPPPGSQPDGTMRGAAAPVNRNADNKFPCSYCNKTYLHLKHLKRHHLRHTGERPYQCGLCHETFCRSDILKRHFNKCSIRRGNPTGANHLTHAQDHLKNPQQQQQQQQQPYANGTSMAQHRPAAISTAAPNPPSSYHNGWPGSARSFDGGYAQPLSGQTVGGSTRSSRSSSIMRPESSSDDDKKRFSSTSTLPTAVGTAETSPAAATQTFPFDRSAAHQRDGSNGYYAAHSSAQMPPLTPAHGEHLPPVTYLRNGGFSQYHQPTHEPHMYQQSWNNAFQPGGSDQLMYSGGH